MLKWSKHPVVDAGWKFLNSGIIILFLSTVAVTYVSTRYAQRAEEQRALLRNEETVERLDFEIEHRLRYLYTLGQDLEITGGQRETIWYAIAGTGQNVRALSIYGESFAPTFPQFDQRSFVSLIWELDNLVTDKDYDQVLAAAALIDDIFGYLDNRVEEVDPVKQKWGLADVHRSRFQNEVWNALVVPGRWEMPTYQPDPGATPAPEASPEPTPLAPIVIPRFNLTPAPLVDPAVLATPATTSER